MFFLSRISLLLIFFMPCCELFLHSLNECSAYLSNYEVFDILKDTKLDKRSRPQNQLATIKYQTMRYLEETACKNQSEEKIQAFLKSVEPFKLTKCEKLSLLNQSPKTPLEIQLLVEESEERLSEEDIESLLQVVKDHIENKSTD